MSEVLAIDAMGVIYEANDDVAELLVPFCRGYQPNISDELISREYLRCSLGEITSDELWSNLGIDPKHEDEYLSKHKLRPGLAEFLDKARERYDLIVCLSNDISEWSIKLRRKFSIDQMFDDWFISGDIGLRKPSPDIYINMLDSLTIIPEQLTFIDDREKNVIAASRLGVKGVLFCEDYAGSYPYSSSNSYSSLWEVLSS